MSRRARAPAAAPPSQILGSALTPAAVSVRWPSNCTRPKSRQQMLQLLASAGVSNTCEHGLAVSYAACVSVSSAASQLAELPPARRPRAPGVPPASQLVRLPYSGEGSCTQTWRRCTLTAMLLDVITL